jgi:hypothetical protein
MFLPTVLKIFLILVLVNFFAVCLMTRRSRGAITRFGKSYRC